MKQGYETADCLMYNILKQNARKLRNHPTEAEAYLWNFLKGSSLKYRFRQQHIIKNYVVDFVCLKCRLIIEIDGGYHNNENQIALDRQRTDELNSLGFEVLRFTNEEVLQDVDTVLSKIKESIIKQIEDGKAII